MSYTNSEIPGLQPGEHGFKLDTGEYVAAKIVVERNAVNSLMRFVANLRQVNADGTPVLDAHSNPVTACHVGNMTAIDLAAHGGVAGYSRTVLDIAMGEPSALADPNDDIRDAILAAKATSSAVDLSTL